MVKYQELSLLDERNLALGAQSFQHAECDHVFVLIHCPLCSFSAARVSD